jgi:hypothetical protein
LVSILLHLLLGARAPHDQAEEDNSSYHLLSCNIIGQDFVMQKMLPIRAHSLGLESCLSKLTYIQTIKKRRSSVEAILSEHHRQLSLGVYDPNTLANVSGAESAWARERARTIAFIHSDKLIRDVQAPLRRREVKKLHKTTQELASLDLPFLVGGFGSKCKISQLKTCF